jgi:peptidylprolyl isomerase
MKNINPWLGMLLMSVVFVSCLKEKDYRTQEDELVELAKYIKENNITATPTWTGLYYIENQVGEGVGLEYYDTAVFGFKAKRTDGQLLESSEGKGPATVIVGGSNLIYGVTEALGYMRQGGKSTAIIPSMLGYGAIQFENLPAYSTIVYEIELLEVKPGVEVVPFNIDTVQKFTTASGLIYYPVVVIDSTQKVVMGKHLKLEYTGYFENGKIFNSTLKTGQLFTVAFGYDQLIEGWTEGLKLMREGEKYRFVVPYGLAYGVSGSYPVIPPHADLTFDVEVVEIK